MAFIAVARTHDIPSGQARAVTLGRREIALFNLDGEFFALENTCPHQGGPIADGAIEDGMVTCPWHAWCFDIRSGKMTIGDFAALTRFAVRVENDAVFVSADPLEQG